MVIVLSLKAGASSGPPRLHTIVVLAAIAFMPITLDRAHGYDAELRRGRLGDDAIYTWQTLWNAALDRPLVGTGFGAQYLHL